MKKVYTEKRIFTEKAKDVFGVKKGKDITFSKETALYYDNKVSGKRERYDGKKGKLKEFDSNRVKVVFSDGSEVISPKAYVNFTKTPEYKRKFK